MQAILVTAETNLYPVTATVSQFMAATTALITEVVQQTIQPLMLVKRMSDIKPIRRMLVDFNVPVLFHWYGQ